jgi:oxygen-independent coproporphyrinogen-3 oxidase
MDTLKDAYVAALEREIEFARPVLHGREVGSIAFGGGTPGEVPPGHIARVIEAVRRLAPLVRDAEVSLEANPGTPDGAALRDLHAAGVTRISFGAQSFDAAELRFLDRIHSPEANAASVALARAAGIFSVGLDLIYGLPGQTRESWRVSLCEAIALHVDHISTYALTVEDGTPLARRVLAGEVQPLDDDQVADLYELASDVLERAGYQQYELSNWSRQGHQSRHNRTYWTDGEYLGIGAGAHGYVGGRRYENVAHPRAYAEAVAAAPGGPFAALSASYIPDRVTAMSDWVGLRLRLLEGFAAEDFQERFGEPPEEALGPVLRDCRAGGVLEIDPRVRLTKGGRLLHGEVAARVLAHLQSVAVGG